MARRSLVSEVVDGVFDDIVARRLVTDAALPSESDLCARFDVSRVTVREAVKTLQAQGVVRVQSGRGSFVEPVERWTSLSAVLAATSASEDARGAAEQLIEVRRLFETGAAALAAGRIAPDDLALLESELERMRAAHRAGDVDAFVAADLAFHDVILVASRNPFLRVMFEPLTSVMSARRRETSQFTEVQVHAIAEHQRVLEALRTGDPEAARQAMSSHMDQTLDDLRTYVGS